MEQKKWSWKDDAFKQKHYMRNNRASYCVYVCVFVLLLPLSGKEKKIRLMSLAEILYLQRPTFFRKHHPDIPCRDLNLKFSIVSGPWEWPVKWHFFYPANSYSLPEVVLKKGSPTSWSVSTPEKGIKWGRCTVHRFCFFFFKCFCML